MSEQLQHPGMPMPAPLTAEDLALLAHNARELQAHGDGNGYITVHSPATRQMILAVLASGRIVGWCLLPAWSEQTVRELAGPASEILDAWCAQARAQIDAEASQVIARAARNA